jgi:hypothetical protein
VSIKPTDSWTRAEKDAARAVLLEPSPYESDGGKLIGRDPRKMLAEDFARAGLEGHPLLTIIRGKCLDCVAQQESEVRKCVAVLCPNWPYRLGANPFRAPRELTEEQRERSVAALARARAARTGSSSQGAPPAILDSKLASQKSDEPSAGV